MKSSEPNTSIQDVSTLSLCSTGQHFVPAVDDVLLRAPRARRPPLARQDPQQQRVHPAPRQQRLRRPELKVHAPHTGKSLE